MTITPKKIDALDKAKNQWGRRFAPDAWRCEVYTLSAPSNDPIKTIDTVIRQLGFDSKIAAWKEMEAPDIRDYMLEDVHEEAAQGADTPVRKKETDLVDAFLGQFSKAAKYYFSVVPITDAPWESNLIVLEGNQLGLFLIKGEE